MFAELFESKLADIMTLNLKYNIICFLKVTTVLFHYYNTIITPKKINSNA